MIEQYVNTEELKRLVSGLSVFLGALVIAALFASIVVPGLRNANQPATPMPVNPAVGDPGWLDPTEFPPQRGREIPPVNAASLITYSPALVEQGSRLFKQDCVQCHGELGQGNGPAAATLNPHPRNFTSPNGWTNGYDLPSIYRTLSEGVKGTGMASFDYLSKADRMALAHFVQSLGSFSHGTGNPEALAALTRELSAPGERTPNRIPVSMAMARLEEEYKSAPVLTLESSDHSAGAEILRRAVTDPARASASLSGNPGWEAGAKELAASVLSDVPGNGFNPGTATWSAADWQVLRAELLKQLRR